MKALTRLTSGLLVFLGIAIVVRTVNAGGVFPGVLIGLLFVAAGAGRLWISREDQG